MRTYGRLKTGEWVEVATDANGYDDFVWITSLAQALKLSPGESPFFADVGIPAQKSVVTQIFPDYYVALMQSRYAQYFTSLTIAKVPQPITANPANPSYEINIVTNRGLVINQIVAT
jgi:hypothetical protein